MKSIILYTQPECPPCDFTKKYLKEKGIPYIEKNVRKDKQSLHELTTVYQSYTTPTIIIGEKVIRGFDLTAIEQELNK